MGLRQPEIFNTYPEITSKTKYESSPLSMDAARSYYEKISEFMISKKPYLQSDLTINDLADKLALHSKYLSQIINEHFGKNYFEFINGYRVEEAKKMLLNSLDNRLTILEILYECGFNSKSSFNAAFKKETGITPTEFRKSIKNSRKSA